jgi:hypothetical protein
MEVKWIHVALCKEEMSEAYCALGDGSLRSIESKKYLVQAFRLQSCCHAITGLNSIKNEAEERMDPGTYWSSDVFC